MPVSLRRYLPALVLFLALVLRLWGIGWGLPDGNHAFSYHPDESMVVGSALLRPGQSLLDTGFYNYGSLATLTDRWLLLALGQASQPVPSATAFLLARLLGVAYGIGTCGLLIALGKRLERPGSGLVAAALYAIAPLAVQHGHFATVDVPATFWVTASLFCALTRPQLFWAGLFAGLAAATKYNTGIVVLAGVAAWFLTEKRAIKPLLLLLAGAALGFLIGCPGALLNTSLFWQQLSFELFVHSRQPDEYFVGSMSGFLYWPFVGLLFALGPGLSVVALAVGVGLGLARRTREQSIVLAFALPYLLLICLSANQYLRYALPLLPALSFLLALPFPPRTHKLMDGLTLFWSLPTLALSVGLCTQLAGPDPRDEALVFLKQKGATSVGFARGPWFWSPPLHPGISTPIPPAAKRAAESSETLRLFAVPDGRDWDAALLEETSPDAVVLSELEYTAMASKATPYLDALRQRYPNQTAFTRPLPLLGPVPQSGTNLPLLKLPVDMRYPSQSVVVFTK